MKKKILIKSALLLAIAATVPTLSLAANYELSSASGSGSCTGTSLQHFSCGSDTTTFSDIGKPGENFTAQELWTGTAKGYPMNFSDFTYNHLTTGYYIVQAGQMDANGNIIPGTLGTPCNVDLNSGHPTLSFDAQGNCSAN